MLPVTVLLVLTSSISVSYSTNQPSVSYRSGKTTPDRPLIFGVPFGIGVYPGYPQPQNIIGGLGGGSLPVAQRMPLTITYPNRYTEPPSLPPTVSANKQTLSELATLLNTQAYLNQFDGASVLYGGFDDKNQNTANEVPKHDGYLVSLPKEFMPILKDNVLRMMNYYVSSANGGPTPNLLMVVSDSSQYQQQMQQILQELANQRPATQLTQLQIQQQSQGPTQQSPQQPATQETQVQMQQQSQGPTQQSPQRAATQQSPQPPPLQQPPQRPMSQISSHQSQTTGQPVHVELPAVQNVPTYVPKEDIIRYQFANSGTVEPYPELGVPVVPKEVKSVGFQLIPSMFRLSKSISNESQGTTDERKVK